MTCASTVDRVLIFSILRQIFYKERHNFTKSPENDILKNVFKYKKRCLNHVTSCDLRGFRMGR
jgi:hypothetical protein